MKVSLISTVFNERHTVGPWLESIRRQSRVPDEVVIVDGGSTDGTWEFLQEAAAKDPLLSVHRDTGNISHGRNAAIGHARHELVAVTDAGCVVHPDWLRELVLPVETGSGTCSATAFGPDFKGGDGLSAYLIAAVTVPAPGEFGRDWLPSSRSVAFMKDAWRAAGGYPEWLPICEDIVFDMKLMKRGARFTYVRTPLVFWRPRPTFTKLFKQLFLYTRSDGHAGLWLRRQLIRYGVYGLAILILVISYAWRDPYPALALIPFGVLYSAKFVRRFVAFAPHMPFSMRVLGIILTPFVLLYGDVAKMCGWPLGVYERLRGIIKYESY